MSIYIVAAMVLTDDGKRKFEHTRPDGSTYMAGDRTWGWYATYEDAEQAVMENHTDMWECDFNYTVIEEVPEGILPASAVKQWFRADRYPALIISRCDPPPYANGVCNFTIG